MKSIKYYIFGYAVSFGSISFIWYLTGRAFERGEDLGFAGIMALGLGTFIGVILHIVNSERIY